MSSFKLKFGEFDYSLECPIISKSPIWNVKMSVPISLDDNLEFANNLVITFTNNHPNQINKMFNDNKVGDIVIQALYMASDKEYDPTNLIEPNWTFHHIIKNGKSNGRILASFYVQKMSKN